jgi:hypothetical protein
MGRAVMATAWAEREERLRLMGESFRALIVLPPTKAKKRFRFPGIMVDGEELEIAAHDRARRLRQRLRMLLAGPLQARDTFTHLCAFVTYRVPAQGI